MLYRVVVAIHIQLITLVHINSFNIIHRSTTLDWLRMRMLAIHGKPNKTIFEFISISVKPVGGFHVLVTSFVTVRLVEHDVLDGCCSVTRLPTCQIVYVVVWFVVIATCAYSYAVVVVGVSVISPCDIVYVVIGVPWARLLRQPAKFCMWWIACILALLDLPICVVDACGAIANAILAVVTLLFNYAATFVLV